MKNVFIIKFWGNNQFQHALLAVLVNLCVTNGGVSVNKLLKLKTSNTQYFKYQMFELFKNGVHVGKSIQEICHELQTRLNLTEHKLRDFEGTDLLL